MLAPHRPHKLHRNHHMALSPSNNWLKAERAEEWLLLDVNGADVNDNVLCTKNMEGSDFDLGEQKG